MRTGPRSRFRRQDADPPEPDRPAPTRFSPLRPKRWSAPARSSRCSTSRRMRAGVQSRWTAAWSNGSMPRWRAGPLRWRRRLVGTEANVTLSCPAQLHMVTPAGASRYGACRKGKSILEISVERNDAARVAAENASESLLKVRIACSSDDFNTYSFYRISKIVGGSALCGRKGYETHSGLFRHRNNGICDLPLAEAQSSVLGVAPSFLVQQIAADKHLGGSARMTLPLLDPQPPVRAPLPRPRSFQVASTLVSKFSFWISSENVCNFPGSCLEPFAEVDPFRRRKGVGNNDESRCERKRLTRTAP